MIIKILIIKKYICKISFPCGKSICNNLLGTIKHTFTPPPPPSPSIPVLSLVSLSLILALCCANFPFSLIISCTFLSLFSLSFAQMTKFFQKLNSDKSYYFLLMFTEGCNYAIKYWSINLICNIRLMWS